MGKKSKTTKAKTSDFQKTKLKVGKKRPLPSNVTEVAFKSQAIYVSEQMKNVNVGEDVYECKEVGIKRNIPELLSQVGHFNKNFRADSLTSLRNSFSRDKNLLKDHLPKVFSKAPASIRDEDQQVRKSSIAFFKCVFSEISSQAMAPFFDGFLLHLYCAMTHIYDDVKKDSLQIFDLCVKYFPDLLTVTSSDKLLQHFIDLISTKRTKSAAKDGKAEVTRVLCMKLSSKDSSIVWRNRILERLYDLLNACGKSQFKNDGVDKFQEYIQKKYDNRSIKCVSHEVGAVLAKFRSKKYSQCGWSSKFPSNTQVSKDKSLSPWELVTTLVPLLIDTWHEATSDESKQFSEDSVTAMTNVLKITNTVIKRFIDSHDNKMQAIIQIRERHLQDFRKYFFDSFPINYAQKLSKLNPKRRKVAKENAQSMASTVHSINLSICEVITTLFPNELIGEEAPLLASVAEYLSLLLVVDCDGDKLELDETGLKQSIAVTKALLKAAMDEETVDSLLRPLLVLFHSLEAGSLEKIELLKFFVSLDSDFKFPRSAVMDEWVLSLPIFLAEILHGKGKNTKCGRLCSDRSSLDVCLLAISTMRLAMVKENMEFVSCFCEKVDFLLEILKEDGPALFCSPDRNLRTSPTCHRCTNILNRLFELFLHPLCDVTIEDMKLMIQICQMEFVPAESVNYAATGFLMRYERYDQQLSDFTASLQFLSSLLIGITRSDLQTLQSSDQNQGFEIIDMCTESQFSRHAAIVDRTCISLRSLDHIQIIMRRFLKEKLLNKCRVFPAHSAFAILKTAVELDLMSEEEASRGDHLVEENVIDKFNFDIGKYLSAILIRCHSDEESLSSVAQKYLSDISVMVMELNSEVLRACIRELGRSECKNHCEVVCRAIGFMMSQSELRENLNLCKSELHEVLENMKVGSQCESVRAMIESTMFCVTTTLSSS